MYTYHQEVKMVDRGILTPQEFVQLLYPEYSGDYRTDWHLIWAAARIYTEDGGRLSYDEFIQSCNPGGLLPDYLEGEQPDTHARDMHDWKEY